MTTKMRYECSVCGYSNNNERVVERHIRINRSRRIYWCCIINAKCVEACIIDNRRPFNARKVSY